MPVFRSFGVHFGEGLLPGDSPFPVTVISLGRERQSGSDYRWNNERHRRIAAHVFQYTRKGRGRFGGTPMTPGRYFLASHSREYDYFGENGVSWEFDFVMVCGPFADEVASEIQTDSGWWEAPASGAALRLADFLESLDRGQAVDRWALSAFGYAFLTDILREQQEPASATDILKQTDLWLSGRWDTVSLAAMAAHFGYQEKYFIRWFKQKTGTTPHSYITETRMKRAASLLAVTNRTVGAIGREVGFGQDTYFTKVFSQRYGMTPSAYRAAHRGSMPADEILLV